MNDTIKITLEGVPPNWLPDEITRMLMDGSLIRSLEQRLDDAVTKRIEELADDVILDRLRAELERALAEGWKRTNTYGEPIGEPISLKERVSRMLENKDPYRSSRWADDVMTKMVDEVYRKELAKPIAEAKEKVKKMLEDKALEGFGNLLRKAAGVEA